MRRHTALMLAGTVGLAIAAYPLVGFGQSPVDPNGLFQLNLSKSKYSLPSAPMSQTVCFQAGRATVVGIDGDGNAIAVVFPELVRDGRPHPVTGSADYDTASSTHVDAYTTNASYMKAGKVVRTSTNVTSQDGKTYTVTTTGTDASGRQINYISVYEKQ